MIFDFYLKYEFMRHGLISIVILSVILGLIGPMVVNNKMSFFSDSIGHCAFTGISIGSVIGLQNSQLSLLLFSVIFAFLMSYVIESEKSSSDTIIGVFSSIGLSLGILILTLIGGISKHSEYFIGDILSISIKEIYFLVILLILTILFWVSSFNKFLISSLNKDLSISKQINFKLYKTLLIIIIAAIVSLSIKWVGMLIINSLLTLPAASSRNISRGMRQYHFFSVLFSLVSGIVGLLLSFNLKTPVGPTVIMVNAFIFILTFIYSHNKS